MRRRRRGTGTIEEMRDGTFRPRMPGAGARLDPFPTYEEAEAQLDAALLSLAKGATITVEGVTLAAHGERFLDARERTHSNAADDRSTWSVHIAKAPFASWPMKAIAAPDIRDWRDGMLSKRAAPSGGCKKTRKRLLSRSRVQNALNLLRSALGDAVERGLIPTNPAEGVKLPQILGETREPWTYLLPEEQERLLECEAIPPAGRCLLAFALGTGMRESEIWNLELRDISATEITVRFGGRGKATKGKRIRRIPRFGIAARALEAWLPMLAKQDANPHRLVWPTARGARRQDGKAPREWETWRAAAGLDGERHDGRPVRFHDLRHSCASSLVAGWWSGRRWSLEEVKKLLGHRSVTTTERYAHLADSALQAAARETDDLSAIHPQPEAEPSFYAAPPAGIGPATFGLGSRSVREEVRELESLRGWIEGLSARAAAGLVAIEAGGPDGWRLVTELLADLARGPAKAPKLRLVR